MVTNILIIRAAQLPTAGTIQEMSDAPGGGYLLTLTDPEGFPLNLIYGQTPGEVKEYPPKLLLNYEIEKPRVRRFQRFELGPAAVHKVCFPCGEGPRQKKKKKR